MKRQKCQATVDHVPRHISLSELPKPYEKKPCPRTSKGKVGHLHLCTAHVRMAREGLIDESGVVACHEARRTVSRYRRKYPHGLYDWARKLKGVIPQVCTCGTTTSAITVELSADVATS